MGRYKKQEGARKGAADDACRADMPALAAIGLEAEFGLVLDGAPIKVEDIFRDPRDFLGAMTVNPFRPTVPADDVPVEIEPDDRL